MGEPSENAEGDFVRIPRETFDRLKAMEQAAIGALHRSCIGCAGGAPLHEAKGCHIRTTADDQLDPCTADPILRDALATLRGE